MGVSFTSLHAKAKNRRRLVVALKAAKALPAYVSDEHAGWVSAYPRSTEPQDPKVLEEVARAVSRKLGAPVFGFLVHDSDFLVSLAFDKGRLVDDYHSSPEYYSGGSAPPRGGDADKLMRFCTPATSGPWLRELLHFAERPTFMEDLLVDFAGALGIARPRVHNIGFEAIEKGWAGGASLRRFEVKPRRKKGRKKKAVPKTRSKKTTRARARPKRARSKKSAR
ncbi:hypothetical protein HY251_11830 [bacterium]|nr:hypothetical protein [bacterium]